MVVTTDAGLAPKVPGYDEVRRVLQEDGSKRSPGCPTRWGMMARPDLAKGMSAMVEGIQPAGRHPRLRDGPHGRRRPCRGRRLRPASSPGSSNRNSSLP